MESNKEEIVEITTKNESSHPPVKSIFKPLAKVIGYAGAEMLRHLLLGQHSSGLIYLSDDPTIFKLLCSLFIIQESDPKHKMDVQIFKWSVICYLNRISPPNENPDVPIDFSGILPEFKNVDKLFTFAQCPTDDLYKIYMAYPYDFFNVVAKMKPKFARDFIIACLFNVEVPIHLGGRLLSFFPLTTVQIDYTLIYETRCESFDNVCLFYEGLLCNCNNQIKAAEILSTMLDTILNDECLLLINGTIRSLDHFVDRDMNMTTQIFPDGQTLSFLRQTANTPLSTIAKSMKYVQSNEYVTRLKNQMILLDHLGFAEEDWPKLEESSVPYLLGDQVNPVILFDLPRDSIFMSYPSCCWKVDFDFTQSLVAIKGFITEFRMNTFSTNLFYDMFSLIFLTQDKTKPLAMGRSSSMSSFPDLSSKGMTKSDSYHNFTARRSKNSKDYVFDVESALNLVTFMKSTDKAPEDIKRYLDIAEHKLRAAQSLYESPTINEALLPKACYYNKALSSIDYIEKITKIYGEPPNALTSRLFALKVEKALGSKIRNESSMPIKGRIMPGQNIGDKIDILISSVLAKFPENLHSTLILDFAASFQKYTLLSAKVTNVHQEFVAHLQTKMQRYPRYNFLNLNDSRSLLEYKKRLQHILNCRLQNSYLSTFSRYLLKLTNIRSQSFYKFCSVRPQGQLQAMVNSGTSLSELNKDMEGTGIDIIEFLIQRNRPDLLSANMMEVVIGEEPMYFIPFAQNFLEPKKVAFCIKNIKFLRVKKYFQIDRSKEKPTSTTELIQKLQGQKPEVIMETLDEYLYNRGDLATCFYDLLELIKDFPEEWVITFLDSLIALLDPDDVAVMPLQQRLLELKPPPDMSFATEIERVSVCWDALMKMVTRYDDIMRRPHEFYRLCSFHLVNHLIGRSLISNIRYFTLVVIGVRNFGLFKTKELEQQWITKFLKSGISSLKVDILAEMIVDIGLNYSYECGLTLAKLCPQIDLSASIKRYLPQSVAILSYVADQVALVNNILSEQKVESEEDEKKLLCLLAKVRNYAPEIPLYGILDDFVHQYIFYRFKAKYSGTSLTKLFDVAMMKDIRSTFPIFEKLEVKMSPMVSKRIEDSYSIFGLVSNRSNQEKKKIFTSPYLNFSGLNVLTVLDTLKSESSQPTLYTLEGDSNSLTVFKLPLVKREIKVHYPSDFPFFELHYQPSVVRISDDTERMMREFLSIGTSPENSGGTPESVKFVNTAQMRKTIQDAISDVNVFQLFESLQINGLQTLLKFANAKGLLNLILQLTTWVLEKPDMYKIFVFAKSALKEVPEFERNAKTFEFIMILKQVLIPAIKFSNDIEATLILTPTVIQTGNTKVLKDVRILLEFQDEVDVKNVNLFNPKSNKTDVVSNLFLTSDYDRGFNMIRILHMDLNKVLLMTMGKLAKESSEKLGKFLFNIIPRLDIDTANKLIETISTLLAKSAQNRPFLNLLVSGVDDSRNVFQMLQAFGFNETATMVAVQEGLSEEVEKSYQEAKSRGEGQTARSCNRWMLQHSKQVSE